MLPPPFFFLPTHDLYFNMQPNECLYRISLCKMVKRELDVAPVLRLTISNMLIQACRERLSRSFKELQPRGRSQILCRTS